LDKKQSVRGIALHEDRRLLFKRQHIPALADGGKEGVGIEIRCSLRGFDVRQQESSPEILDFASVDYLGRRSVVAGQ
jgi:hypothetical protein